MNKKIRYQLIGTQADVEEEFLSDEGDRKRFLRPCLCICFIVLLIVCYNLSGNINDSYAERQTSKYLTTDNNNVVEKVSSSISLRGGNVGTLASHTQTSEERYTTRETTTRSDAENMIVRPSKSSMKSGTESTPTLGSISSTESTMSLPPVTLSRKESLTESTTRKASNWKSLRTKTPNTTSKSITLKLSSKSTLSNGSTVMDNYFVHTSMCHMHAPNAFAHDVMKIFHRKSYFKCDKSKDMLTVNYDSKERRYQLHINEENSRCSYRSIVRAGDGVESDNKYSLLPSSNFHQNFIVPHHVEAVLTECQLANGTKVKQKDAFAFVQPMISNATVTARRPSVLLWGIDSMSRMNFQRTMPLMQNYLRTHQWHELQGYSKMGDNTFPNLMAILTGYNNSKAYNSCQPTKTGALDACPMLWKDYKQLGYITAFAEDWAKFSTFNYHKKGFTKQPTDYYLRPLTLAIEKELKERIVSTIPFCVGRRHYAEYIYDYAVQFTEIYKDQSTFGMFWTNSFSHNDFSLPTSMDAKIVEYMRTLDRNGIMDNSIILFFSDHGMRFGPLRKLESGFLEERLPIMYIWLPKWFRQQYPNFVRALQLNRNRLTSPFDIHATLKHILQLETTAPQLSRPEGCPSCHSVFFEVSESRDCSDAGISEHWCSCNIYQTVPSTDATVAEITQQLVDATNAYIAAKNLTNMCSILTLSKIVSAETQEKLGQASDQSIYRVRYETKPKKALFEATVVWKSSSRRIGIDVDDISRLSKYAMDSKCINNKKVEKFCICRRFK